MYTILYDYIVISYTDGVCTYTYAASVCGSLPLYVYNITMYGISPDETRFRSTVIRALCTSVCVYTHLCRISSSSKYSVHRYYSSFLILFPRTDCAHRRRRVVFIFSRPNASVKTIFCSSTSMPNTAAYSTPHVRLSLNNNM